VLENESLKLRRYGYLFVKKSKLMPDFHETLKGLWHPKDCQILNQCPERHARPCVDVAPRSIFEKSYFVSDKFVIIGQKFPLTCDKRTNASAIYVYSKLLHSESTYQEKTKRIDRRFFVPATLFFSPSSRIEQNMTLFIGEKEITQP
jgi:hypothetical protein